MVKWMAEKTKECVLLGKRIATLRKELLNLSQEAFAPKIPLHRTYLSGVESGARNPSYTALLAISRALGISVSKMLEGIE
jgi:transcriptional regulator with XRE-family HTH domain